MMPGQKMVHKGFIYTQKDIDEAVASIKCGMSKRSAAKKFAVRKSTLSDVISGKKKIPKTLQYWVPFLPLMILRV